MVEQGTPEHSFPYSLLPATAKGRNNIQGFIIDEMKTNLLSIH
jgi:hypothetical protein